MVKLTKQDVAERQLKTAISIWSAEGDVVSVHTLAAASLEILDKLAASSATSGSILSNPKGLIKDSKIKEYYFMIRRPQNFFKHADEDLQEVIDFNETIPELFLLDALSVYGRLTGASMALECKMAFWYLCIKNDAILDTNFIEKNERFYAELKGLYQVLGRRDFVYLSFTEVPKHPDDIIP
jgi:hypothetical protein